jgi:glycosyltransferase involved in cell wall biosynthesis
MFKIIIIAGPAQKYIKKCLSSLVSQEYTNWQCQVIIDPVDQSYQIAKEFESEKLSILQNKTNEYALANIIKAVNLLTPNDEDILIMIDGDDWLINSQSFSIVNKYYENNSDLLITHGSWTAYPNPDIITNNLPYTEEHFKTSIRKGVSWRASHLKTMKYKVWKHIKDEDFRSPDGTYFRSSWDLTIMWPALEMAGFKRYKFIPEILYVYNQETPFNDAKLRLQEQMFFTDYIAAKSPYKYKKF